MKKVLIFVGVLFWVISVTAQSGYNIYNTNQYGIQEKSGEIRKNSNGTYDIYKKNQYGIQEKTGTVKPKSSNWPY